MKAIVWFSFLLVLTPSGALAQDWDVKPERQNKLSARYAKLVFKQPHNDLFFRQWTRTIGDIGIKAEIDKLAKMDRTPSQTLVYARLLASNAQAQKALETLAVLKDPEPSFLIVRANIRLQAQSETVGDSEKLRVLAIADLRAAIDATTKKKQKRALIRKCIDVLLRGNRPHDSLPFFEALIAVTPNDLSLQREFATVLVENGEYPRAITLYESSLKKIRSGKRRAQVLKDLGETFEKTNQYERAETTYKKARSLSKRNSWFRREVNQKLIRLHRKLGTIAVFFPELESEWKSSSSQWLNLATLAQEVGRPEVAKKYLTKAVRRFPNNVVAAQTLVKTYELEGKIVEARKVYATLVKNRRNDPRVGSDFANWLFYSGKDSDAARKHLEKVRAMGTKPTSDVLAAETLLRWGVHQDAIAILELVEKTHPEDPLHIEVYGSLLAKLGKKKEALAVWRRLNTDTLGRIRYAELCASKDFIDEAIEGYEAVVEARPKHWQLKRSLAELYEVSSDHQKAMALWEDVFHNTRDATAGEKLVFLSRYEPDAEKRFAKKFRTSAHWGLVLAEVAIAEGAAQRGLNLLQTTIQRSLASGNRYGRVTASIAARRSAEIQHQQLKFAQSVMWWERLARNFPEHRLEGYRKAVKTSMLLPEPEATAILDRATEKIPFDAEVHAERAYRAAEHSKFELAIENMQRAISRNPSKVEYRFELAYYLLQLGYADKARETYADIVQWDRPDSVDAAFNALDLCVTAEHVEALETKFRKLEHKIQDEAFVTIMLDVYHFIFIGLANEKLAESVAPHAIRILGQALNSTFEDERSLALQMLALFDDSSAFDAILAATKDQSTEFSLSLLARSANKRSIPTLRKALDSEDPKQRRIAWLGLVSAGDQKIVDDLENAIIGGSREDRIVAAWALRSQGEKAQRILQRAWEAETEGTVKDVLLWALAKSGKAARDTVVKVMTTAKGERAKIASLALAAVADEKTRLALFSALWAVDSAREDVVLYGLSKHVEQLQTSIWKQGEGSVDSMDDPYQLILEKLTDAFFSEDDAPLAWSFETFPRAVVSAAKHGLEDDSSRERVLEDLLGVAYIEFEKPDDDIERRANQVATVIDKLRPTLKRIVKNDPDLRFKACEAIPFAQKPQDLPFLLSQVSLTKSQEDITRLMAPIGFYPKKHVIPTIEKMLKGKDENEQLGAIAAVSYMRGLDIAERQNMARLVEGYVDTEGPIQIVAVEALGVLKDPDSLPILAEAFKDGDAEKRNLILSIVRRFDTPKARVLHRKMTVMGVTPPCSGDQEDLPNLLKDRCDAVFEIDD